MKNISNRMYATFGRIDAAVTSKVRSYINGLSAQQKAAFAGSFAATSLLLPGSASAQSQSDGFASMGSKTADQSDSLTSDYAGALIGIGVAVASYGGFMLKKRSDQGNAQGQANPVPMSKVVVPIISGAVLASIGTVMTLGGETIGLSSTDYGTIPSN